MAPEPAAHSRSNVDAMLYLPAPSWKSGIYRRVVDAEVVDEPSLSQLNEGFRLQWRRRRRRSSNNGARGTGGRRSQKTKPFSERRPLARHFASVSVNTLSLMRRWMVNINKGIDG